LLDDLSSITPSQHHGLEGVVDRRMNELQAQLKNVCGRRGLKVAKD